MFLSFVLSWACWAIYWGLYMFFANICTTSVAHKACFFLSLGAHSWHLFLLPLPSLVGMDVAECSRGWCIWKVVALECGATMLLPSFAKHSLLVVFALLPSWIDLTPNHKGAIGWHINDIEKHPHKPTCHHSFAGIHASKIQKWNN